MSGDNRIVHESSITPRPFPGAVLLHLIDGPNRNRAAVLGVTMKQIDRYRHGFLSAAVADELAHRAGLHPCEVWGDLWWTQADQEAAAS